MCFGQKQDHVAYGSPARKSTPTAEKAGRAAWLSRQRGTTRSKLLPWCEAGGWFAETVG